MQIHKTESPAVTVTENTAEDAGNTGVSAAKDGKPTAEDDTGNTSKLTA